MSKWEKVRLGELGKFKTGGTPQRSNPKFFQGEIPWITTVALGKKTIDENDAIEFISEEALQKSSTKLIKANSVMIGTRVGVGKASINTVAMATNQDILSVEDIDDNVLFKPFFIYFINSCSKQINSFKRGATIQGISSDVLKKLLVPLPPLSIQNQITFELDHASELLALRKRQLKELDQLIKSVFYEMFGDPVTNEKGWETKLLRDVVEFQRGFDLPVQHRVNTGNVEVYGSNGVLDFHTEAKAQQGVITGRSGTIGKVYYTFNEFWPLNTTLFSINTHNNNIVYLKYLLDFIDISRFSSGTGVPTLNRNIIHAEKIISVPLYLQTKFAEKMALIEMNKSTVKQSIHETQLLFDSLMSKYFDD